MMLNVTSDVVICKKNNKKSRMINVRDVFLARFCNFSMFRRRSSILERCFMNRFTSCLGNNRKICFFSFKGRYSNIAQHVPKMFLRILYTFICTVYTVCNFFHRL